MYLLFSFSILTHKILKKKSIKDLDQSLSVLKEDHQAKMKEIAEKRSLIDQEFKNQLKNI